MPREKISRRKFGTRASATAAAWTLAVPAVGPAAPVSVVLQAGEATVDTTPPLGIEMAGFHRAPGKERKITGIRQPAAARALVLQCGETSAAVVSVDICGVSSQMALRVQASVARRTGIPAAHVRICATHTHSMPTLRYFRQWGAVSLPYMARVEQQIVLAVERAKADLAPAELLVGKSRAEGANFNRASKTWKTDKEFDKDSTDADRWLDTMVRVLHFRRRGLSQSGRRDLLWYHFSAHPVCYTDEKAGPDWPGLVDKLLQEEDKLRPSFLQGHIGDVNPGGGKPWLGVPDDVASRVAAAVRRAIATAKPVEVDAIKSITQQVQLPLDVDLLGRWMATYRQDPSKCNSGPWVDARFAEDWFASAARWDLARTSLSVPITALRLGPVAVLFHPAELYSVYGLRIQRDSPLDNTLVVGYTDDLIGYLPDPAAYLGGEYSAIVVPKIIGLPPFRSTAGGKLAAAAAKLLDKANT